MVFPATPAIRPRSAIAARKPSAAQSIWPTIAPRSGEPARFIESRYSISAFCGKFAYALSRMKNTWPASWYAAGAAR